MVRLLEKHQATPQDELLMRKVLIVDDQPEIRELVKVTLELGKFRTLSAENGQQALDIARVEHPDMILLDIKMPGSNVTGLDVCRRLKNDPATADIYIIIISASGQQYDVRSGKSVGADDYLVKPFSPIALLDKVEEVMRARL